MEVVARAGTRSKYAEVEEEEEPQKGCWKIDLNDEACYIDVDLENQVLDVNHRFSEWHNLPNVLLEEIFTYLDPRQRYYASLVCRNWYSCFYLPRVWSMFLVDDHTLTRQRYNYYSGWQHTLDHLRTQYCLHRVGRHIKGLDFRPLHSFNNLFQFMTLVSWCIEQSRRPNPTPEVKEVGARITTLNYLFPCNMAAPDDPDGIKLFGTGGQLLAELKRLLGNVATGLRSLTLTDLMLDRYEAKHLLDEVLQSGQMMLRRLSLVNATTVHCPIMHVGLFLNLQTLVISPQNIDDDLLLLFADSRLRHLHILQSCYTPSHRRIESCSARAWSILKRDNPKLMVHLRLESLATISPVHATLTTAAAGGGPTTTEIGEILWQPEAPVRSVLYKAPHKQMTKPGSMIRAMDLYKTTLTIYGHELMTPTVGPSSDSDNEVSVNALRVATRDDTGSYGVPNKELGAMKLVGEPEATKEEDEEENHLALPRNYVTPWPDFDNRIDSVAVLLARQAPNLSVLLLKDPVSTATLLLIAKAAVNLRRFYVLRDAVRCVCDWPPNPDWTSSFYEWLCLSSATVESTEREISQILDCRWQLLDSHEYQKVVVNVRQSE